MKREELKNVWIDEENRILAFHPIRNSRKFAKTEDVFWNWVVGLTRVGYRVM